MDYKEIANSAVMWFAVIPAVLLTFFQAGIFTKRAVTVGKKIGITNQQFKDAALASAAASIGPALVIAVGCLVLIHAIGGPMAWMRLAYIGSVMFELMAADFGASAAGVKLGGEGMNLSVYAVCCWTMCIGCMGWIILTGLFTHKLGAISEKVSGGKVSRLAILSAGGAIGAYSYMLFDRVIVADIAKLNKGNVIAVIVAFVLQFTLLFYGRKAGKSWPLKWGMPIATFSGMILAGLLV